MKESLIIPTSADVVVPAIIKKCGEAVEDFLFPGMAVAVRRVAIHSMDRYLELSDLKDKKFYVCQDGDVLMYMSDENYFPTGSKMLIKRDVVTQIKGIHTAGKREFNTGVIVRCGEFTDKMFKEGMRVHWSKNAGINIQPDVFAVMSGKKDKTDFENMFICNDEDVLGIFEETVDEVKNNQ
ncbi:hypothetical protein EBZ39_07895 [bacterium]|nr:hypothetical protein [bacterium]